MDIKALVVLSAALWALLRWWIQPAVQHRFRTRSALQRVGKTGLLTLIEQLVRVSAVTALTMAGVAVGLGILWLVDVSPASIMGWAAPVLGKVQSALRWVGEIASVGGLLALLGALLFTTYWLGRRETERRIRQHIADEFERLRARREATPTEWPELPATPDMQRIEEQMRPLLLELETLGPETESETAEQAAHRASLVGCIRRLLEARDVLDYERRIDVASLDANVTRPEHPSPGQRLAFFLFSHQLRKDLKASSRLASVATLAVTILTLIGLQASPLGAAVTRSLNRLEVKLSAAEAAQSWAEATAVPTPATAPATPAWAADDEEVAGALAHAYVRAVASSRIWRIGELQPEVERVSRSVAVRRAIVGRPDAAAAPARVSVPLGDVEAEVLRMTEAPAADDRVAARVAEELRKDIRQHAQQRPWAWARIKPRIAEHIQAYGKVTPLGEIHAQLVKETIGVAMDVVKIDASSPVGRLAADVADDMGRDVVRDVVRAELNRTLVRLHAGQPLDDALDLVRSGHSGRTFTLRLASGTEESIRRAVSEPRLVAALRERMPSVPTRVETPSSAVEIDTIARRVLSVRGGRAADSRVALEALASYEDYFPAQYAAEERTVLGKLEASLRQGPEPGAASASGPGGGGGGGGGVRPNEPRAARSRPGPSAAKVSPAVSVARSRSFSMARGFARVGGVVIGREPEQGAASPSVTDVKWIVADGQVRLSAVDAQRREIALGLHPAELVNLALQYAADGRVTTVTMTTAAPLQELKILLHPSLVDSALGCAATELDRLVDTFARQDGQVRGAEEALQNEYALYRFAWRIRQSVLAQQLGARGGELRALTERELSDPGQRARVTRALAERRLAGAPEQSILLSRPAYFDPQLVGRLRELTQSAITIDRLAAGLREDAEQYLKRFRPSSDSDPAVQTLARWLSAPPTFEVWSGVREAPYAVDKDLDFARRAPGGTAPFEFILQASFTSEPEFGDAGGATFFELTHVQGRIGELIAGAIRGRPGEAETVARMRQFALLQRFFRAALDGRLGREFPVEKLPALAHATAGPRGPIRTPRWNVRPGQLEQVLDRVLAFGLAAPDIAATPDAAGALRRCAVAVGASRQGPGPGARGVAEACALEGPIKAQAALCDAGGDGAPCRRLDVLRTVSELAQGVQLRQLLGVAADEERLRRGALCTASR